VGLKATLPGQLMQALTKKRPGLTRILLASSAASIMAFSCVLSLVCLLFRVHCVCVALNPIRSMVPVATDATS
jgi:hypothetical protein